MRWGVFEPFISSKGKNLFSIRSSVGERKGCWSPIKTEEPAFVSPTLDPGLTIFQDFLSNFHLSISRHARPTKAQTILFTSET